MFGELSQEQIDELLHAEMIGRLGCYNKGKVYIVPINYVYDEDYIYGHSLSGAKLEIMHNNPQVCFQVDHIVSLSNWQSVLTWGTFEELTGEPAAYGEWLLGRRLVSLIAGGQSLHRLYRQTVQVPQHHLQPFLSIASI